MLFLHLLQPKLELKLPTFRGFPDLDFFPLTGIVVTVPVSLMAETRSFTVKNFY